MENTYSRYSSAMLLPKKTSLVWISEESLATMLEEAEDNLPNETGGVILGYWNNHYTEAVVTHITGPGPKAVHNRRSFRPDSEYQEAEIAKHYQESGRLHTYMGDWHTHPNGKVYLSETDLRTLRRIATCKDARLPTPLMAVLGGVSKWVINFWCYQTTRLGKFGIRIKTKELKIKLY